MTAAQVLAALYDEASGDGNFGKPARPPLEYSRVCVADPAKAGKGDCKVGKRGWGAHLV